MLACGTLVTLPWPATGHFTCYQRWKIMTRLLVVPGLAAIATLFFLSACAQPSVAVIALTPAVVEAAPVDPFMAQVVGVQWLNPLQRRDYPTEWQLLWTLGLLHRTKTTIW